MDGFGLKLHGVLNVISWCGLIYYLIMCAIGICLFFVPQLVKYLKSRILVPKYYPHIEELPDPDKIETSTILPSGSQMGFLQL